MIKISYSYDEFIFDKSHLKERFALELSSQYQKRKTQADTNELMNALIRLGDNKRFLGKMDAAWDVYKQLYDEVHKTKEEDNHEKSILQQGFFLMTNAYDPPLIEYRSIEYFRTMEELCECIQHEYSGTNAEIVTTYSFPELLNGQVYKIEHRQGTSLSDICITLVHDRNLDKLYRFLDCTEVTDDEGNAIYLSECMKTAEDANEISKIICIFNESQDNYW